MRPATVSKSLTRTGAEGVDRRADIYALGIVAYEIFTGAVPFSADTPVAVLMKHILDPVPLPRRDSVPESLASPILKALAKSKDDRWPTATSLAQALCGGLETAASEANKPTETIEVPRVGGERKDVGRIRGRPPASVTPVPAHRGPIEAVAISKTGRWGSSNGRVKLDHPAKLWDLANGTKAAAWGLPANADRARLLQRCPSLWA